MVRIAIVYFSKSNITAQIAKAIASGANQEDGVMVLEHRIDGHEIIEGRFENAELFEQLKLCNAIIFGSPTYTHATSKCLFQSKRNHFSSRRLFTVMVIPLQKESTTKWNDLAAPYGEFKRDFYCVIDLDNRLAITLQSMPWINRV